MRFGIMFKFGDIVFAKVQYTDTFEVKTRPALVLFEEYGNVVVAGITSNLNMKGIQLTKKEGLPKDSVVKLNYIFTISEKMIIKQILSISEQKKKLIKNEFVDKIR